jgi:hypothetical protein
MGGAYIPRIEDERISALEAFRTKFPGQQEPATNLMEIEKPIGEYDRIDLAPENRIPC